MVDIYRSEDEQIAQLKKWWSDNGTAIIVGVILALVVVYGWRAWQSHQEKTVNAASAVYEQLVEQSSQLTTVTDGVDAIKEQVTQHIQTLKNEHSGTTYAYFAALLGAKLFVQDNDLHSAEQELRWVLNTKPEKSLYLVAQLRLARVLFAKGEFDDALSLLKSDDADLYTASYLELEGDIYLAQGRKEEAYLAYQKAMSNTGNAQLQIKLDDLAGINPTGKEQEEK